MPGLPTTWGPGCATHRGNESPCGHPSLITPALLEARRAGRQREGAACYYPTGSSACPCWHPGSSGVWQPPSVVPRDKLCQGVALLPLSSAPTCLGSRVTKPSAVGWGRQARARARGTFHILAPSPASCWPLGAREKPGYSLARKTYLLRHRFATSTQPPPAVTADPRTCP